MDASLDPQRLLKLGKALSPLRSALPLPPSPFAGPPTNLWRVETKGL
jgi:hypothetical protein